MSVPTSGPTETPQGTIIQAVCAKCQRQMSMKLIGRYYEGKCVCGERWQMPQETGVTTHPMTEREKLRNELLDHLEGLYLNYYAKEKEPGILDARRIWQELMKLYERLRNTN